MLLLATLLVASGCTVPGSTRIQGPPDALPKPIRFLPGDALGWTLIANDADAASWAPIEAATKVDLSTQLLTAQWAPFFAEGAPYAELIKPWVGARSGMVILSIDMESVSFSDVRDRGKLESMLRTQKWSPADDDLGEGAADELDLWVAPSGATQQHRAIAIADDALLAAGDVDALRSMLKQTDRKAAVLTRATNDFSIEALRTPAALVYSSDIVRDQVRHLVKEDRGELEFARWLLEIRGLAAWRDGWIGIAPPIDRERTAMRLIGAAEWDTETAVYGEPTPAPLGVLEGLDADVRVGVAMHNPGMLARDFISSGPGDGSGFATEEDVPTGGINLLELVDRYDGAAAIGYYRDHIELRSVVASSDRPALIDDTRAAIKLAGTKRLTVDSTGPRDVGVTWAFDATPSIVAPDHESLGDAVHLPTLFARAGKPPRQPIMWLYARTDPSNLDVEPVIGWVTWDKAKRMSYAFDVSMQAATTFPTKL